MTKRIALYWHNGRGLGHISRAGILGRALLDRLPGAAVVGVTGSMRGHELLPSGMDLVKLPSAGGAGEGSIPAEPVLGITPSELVRLRERLLGVFICNFRPDALVVDHHPQGRRGELLTALSTAPPPRILLGWKGIPDDGFFQGEDLFGTRMVNFLLRQYERILVYMDPAIFDLEARYRIPPALRERLVYTGYVTRSPSVSRREARETLEVAPEDRLVVISFGGAPGIEPRWHQVLDGLERVSPLPERVACAVGPYLEPDAARRVAQRVARHPGWHVAQMLDSFPSWLAASDLLIGAGGYNTLAEVLAAQANALIIPRHMGDQEQRMHAERLAALRLIRHLDLTSADDAKVASAIASALAEPYPHASPTIAIDGARRATEIIGA